MATAHFKGWWLLNQGGNKGFLDEDRHDGNPSARYNLQQATRRSLGASLSNVNFPEMREY